MTNVDKLKGKIKEKRLTPEKLAAIVGIDKSTMYRKLNNGGDEFTMVRLILSLRLCHLTLEKLRLYFLANLSHKCDYPFKQKTQVRKEENKICLISGVYFFA